MDQRTKPYIAQKAIGKQSNSTTKEELNAVRSYQYVACSDKRCITAVRVSCCDTRCLKLYVYAVSPPDGYLPRRQFW